MHSRHGCVQEQCSLILHSYTRHEVRGQKCLRHLLQGRLPSGIVCRGKCGQASCCLVAQGHQSHNVWDYQFACVSADDGDDGGFGDSAGWGDTDFGDEESIDTGDLLEAPRKVEKISVPYSKASKQVLVFIRLSSIAAIIGSQSMYTVDILLSLSVLAIYTAVHECTYAVYVFVMLAAVFCTAVPSVSASLCLSLMSCRWM